MKCAIAVQSCVANETRRDSIRKTWLRDVPCEIDTFFFVGGEGCEDATVLPCGDGYEHCAQKQFAMFNHLKQYDHSFFCDDDTYVVVDRLMACGYEQHDYMGCPCHVRDGDMMMAHGGAGFWASKKAINLCLEVGLDDPELKGTTFSDRAVGYAMRKVGIALRHDIRFNIGKYNGKKGFCNLVPNRQNKYITAHYVTPEMAPLLYAHFKEGVPLPANRYSMEFLGVPVNFMEFDGRWFYRIVGTDKLGGWFEFSHDAEVASFQDIMRNRTTP